MKDFLRDLEMEVENIEEANLIDDEGGDGVEDEDARENATTSTPIQPLISTSNSRIDSNEVPNNSTSPLFDI
jgi:hypothetical protein